MPAPGQPDRQPERVCQWACSPCSAAARTNARASGCTARRSAAARSPALFAGLGVPDTVEGRFDLVAVHVAVLIRRLRNDPDRRGAALAQAVFDAMFADMDLNLREMGVGDLSVGKKVRQAWEAFHGRGRAPEAARASADEAARKRRSPAMSGAASRPKARPRASRRLGQAQAAHLAGQGIDALLAGRVRYPNAAEMLS